MPAKNIIVGQAISHEKHERSKELRRDMTPEERIVWKHVRGNRSNGLSIRRQQIIEGFIVDFYCHSAGVVIEIDGPIHEVQADYDADRDRILHARGLTILRVKNEDVRSSVAKVLEMIVAACTKA